MVLDSYSILHHKNFGNTSVSPVSSVRDLGVYLDADVTMYRPTSLLSLDRVSRHFDGSAAYGVLYHDMPC